MAERIITVDLEDGLQLAVVAQQHGPQLVADKDVTARLSAVTRSIEVVAREALAAARKAAPDKATVELGFGLAVEEGTLVALLGKGRAEA
jgi:NTP-dependent ternary system trypsin peptidase co-occuring protein